MRPFLLSAVILLSAGQASSQTPGLPVVEEDVDEIMVVSITRPDSMVTFERVIFIRDGKAFANRLLVEEMYWSMEGQKFVLTWDDYWSAHRRVSSPKLSQWNTDYDWVDAMQTGPWWVANRAMTDLRQP